MIPVVPRSTEQVSLQAPRAAATHAQLSPRSVGIVVESEIVKAVAALLMGWPPFIMRV